MQLHVPLQMVEPIERPAAERTLLPLHRFRQFRLLEDVIQTVVVVVIVLLVAAFFLDLFAPSGCLLYFPVLFLYDLLHLLFHQHSVLDVHPQMGLEVVLPVESLIANAALELPVRFVHGHVPGHVRFPVERPVAQITFVRTIRAIVFHYPARKEK